MIPQLSALEARVIGSLIEKQITTPEQYPLSLNALVLACNQKSNRDPVVELTDRAVQELVDGLMRRHLVLEKSGFGSRVAKYQQRFCNTEFSTLQFTPQERAIVCELLLRGPQTPGELRARASRMAEITDVSQVETALEQLAQRTGGACVVRLAREPGKRETRYAQLCSAQSESPASSAVPLAAPPSPPSADADAGSLDRLGALEQQVRELRAELQALRAAVQGRADS
ncbi:MAG: YceH family protein [Steroidobacterales bacterium]